MLQNTRLQRNGRQSSKSYYGMSNSCVKSRSIGLRTYTSKLKGTAKMYVSPTMTNGFEMCGVLNANDGLWGLSRLLEAGVVVGWRFRFRYNVYGHLWTTSKRPATGSQQYVQINTLTSFLLLVCIEMTLASLTFRTRHGTAVYIKSDLN